MFLFTGDYQMAGRKPRPVEGVRTCKDNCDIPCCQLTDW
jgi:hypothetical protein